LPWRSPTRSARQPRTTFPRSAPPSAVPSSPTPCLRGRSPMTSADSGCCPSSSPCSPRRSYAMTRAIPPPERWSRPRCGRHPGRSRSPARTPRSWAGRSKSWPDPTRPASWGSTSCSTITTPHGSYWYLQFLGVAPAWQGQGIGSALMTPVLERCDREGVRAYLDATSERNKRLYERHGFVAQDRFAPPGGPPIWPMWRQPASDR
jgi:hypothetical protein